MKEIVKKWIEYAKRDLNDAEVLFKNKRYWGSIYHCHQAVEKTLKAVLVANNKVFSKTHDLLDLLKSSNVNYTKEILEFIQELNPYYNPIRYPDIPEAISLKLRFQKAKRILQFTKIIIKWLLFQIQK